jgi:hypothetical protein
MKKDTLAVRDAPAAILAQARPAGLAYGATRAPGKATPSHRGGVVMGLTMFCPPGTDTSGAAILPMGLIPKAPVADSRGVPESRG